MPCFNVPIVVCLININNKHSCFVLENLEIYTVVISGEGGAKNTFKTPRKNFRGGKCPPLQLRH